MRQPTEAEWRARYSPWWPHTREFARFVTMDRCCLNPSHHADEVHHAYYGMGGLSVLLLGSVIVGAIALMAILLNSVALTIAVLVASSITIGLAIYAAHFRLPIPGFEIPGWQIFPLCLYCHQRIAHHRGNYTRDYTNPIWGNENTIDFLWRLRFQFWGWAACGWGAIALVFAGLIFLITRFVF